MSGSWTLEGVKDLVHFLQVTGPQWSRGDIARVIEKLKTIGITDVPELVSRVSKNTINDDFVTAGYQRFSRETVDSIKQNAFFVRSLDNDVHWPSVQQVGVFAPLPQLLSRTRVANSNSARRLDLTGGQRRKKLHRSCSSPVGSMCGRSGGMASTFSEGFSSCESGSDFDMDGESSVRLKGKREKTGAKGRARAERIRPVIPTMTLMPELGDHMLGAFGSIQESPHGSSVGSFTPGTLSPPSRHTICSSSQFFPGAGVGPAQGPQIKMRSASVVSAPLPGFQDANSPTKLQLPPGRAGGMRSSSVSSVSDTPGHRFTYQPLELGDSHEPSQGEIARLQRAGASMQKDALVARWMSTRRKDALLKGEDMLREQAALDDQGRLMRQMGLTVGDNKTSPMRAHVTGNIRARLDAESSHDAEVRETKHRCMKIRKDLASIANSRRELSNLRSAVQALAHEEEVRDTGKDFFETVKLMGGFGKKKEGTRFGD